MGGLFLHGVGILFRDVRGGGCDISVSCCGVVGGSILLVFARYSLSIFLWFLAGWVLGISAVRILRCRLGLALWVYRIVAYRGFDLL